MKIIKILVVSGSFYAHEKAVISGYVFEALMGLCVNQGINTVATRVKG